MMQKYSKILCGLRKTVYPGHLTMHATPFAGEAGEAVKSAAVPAPGLHPTPFEFLCVQDLAGFSNYKLGQRRGKLMKVIKQKFILKKW